VSSFTKLAKEGNLDEKSSAQRAILTNGLSGEKPGSGEAVYLLVTDSAESVAELGSKTYDRSSQSVAGALNLLSNGGRKE
jgi:hypothetical protein